jgi:hypothetical protein
VLAFVLFDYARIKIIDMEYGFRRRRTPEQRSALQDMASRIKDLEGQLAKLNLFDKKIRIIANMEKGADAGRSFRPSAPGHGRRFSRG